MYPCVNTFFLSSLCVSELLFCLWERFFCCFLFFNKTFICALKNLSHVFSTGQRPCQDGHQRSKESTQTKGAHTITCTYTQKHNYSSHAFFNNVRDLCIDLQELTENGYSEEPSSTQLPSTHSKDSLTWDQRRPITVHFGQVGVGNYN